MLKIVKSYTFGLLGAGLVLISPGWSSEHPEVQVGQVAASVETVEGVPGALRRLSSQMAVLELHTEVPALLRHAKQLREVMAITITQSREFLTPVTQDFEALPKWPADPSELALLVASKGEGAS